MKIFTISFLLLIPTMFVGCSKKNKSDSKKDFYELALKEVEKRSENSYKQAVYYLDLALEQHADERCLTLKTAILLRLGGLAEAEEGFKKILSCNVKPKEKAGVLNNYACLLAQQGRRQDAINIWDKLEKSKYYQTPEIALFNQARLFILKGDYWTAKNKLYQATLYAPRYVDAHYYLALVANKHLKDYELAKREAEIVLSLNSSHEEAKKLLAIIDKKEK